MELRNIEAERSRIGMTRTELAKRMGVSLNTMSGYVSGSPIPSTILCEMADLFGVSTDYLLGRTKKDAQQEQPTA